MYIADTHTLLWFLYNDGNISNNAKSIMEESEYICVSIASLWEIAIKQCLGKIENQDSIESMASICIMNNINILEIMPKHLDCLKLLPSIHKDPFDRLIIAQAMANNMTIVTRDKIIPLYDCVETIW